MNHAPRSRESLDRSPAAAAKIHVRTHTPLVLMSVLILAIAGCSVPATYQVANPSLKTKKILIVVTNHADYPTRHDKTGLWVTELTHFYDVMDRAGFQMDIASPLGGKTPLDERSRSWIYMDKAAKAHLSDAAFVAKLESTIRVADVNPADYVAIYFTGGHGTMWDFRDNAELAKVAERIYNDGGYVTSVCHGAAGLLNLRLPDGTPLISGRRVTGFSNTEEWLAGTTDQVPFFLQNELAARGSEYMKAVMPFTSYAITDGRLVTGQNPFSGKAVAIALIRAMNAGPELPAR
ncbi:MAG: type 1 glutamine amidotransferase domain-containing protein [Kofleriaceae bacterium]